MPDFTIRSESVDVEQIMKQIRSRIRDKRGVDYTEDEIRELAGVKLEKFLDPTKVRSELLEQYRKGRRASAPAPIVVPPAPPNYAFDAATAYTSSRGVIGSILRLIRKVLNPILKLFINPNPIIHSLSMQGDINNQTSIRFDKLVEALQLMQDRLQRQDAVRAELDGLNYEVLHNMVLEVTRTGIEVKNIKMRVESLASRLEFDERRARALEGVVLYRPGAGPVPEAAPPPSTSQAAAAQAGPAHETTDPAAGSKGEALRSRRRRRRRGRQGGGSQAQHGQGESGQHDGGEGPGHHDEHASAEGGGSGEAASHEASPERAASHEASPERPDSTPGERHADTPHSGGSDSSDQ
jgi:hypothetical protein